MKTLTRTQELETLKGQKVLIVHPYGRIEGVLGSTHTHQYYVETPENESRVVFDADKVHELNMLQRTIWLSI